MTISLELSERELDDIRSFTGENDASAAIRTALLEYVRYARRMGLKALSGKVEMEENWPTLESLELRAHDAGSEASAG